VSECKPLGGGGGGHLDEETMKRMIPFDAATHKVGRCSLTLSNPRQKRLELSA